jgi:RNA polymerase sigma-70 factor, ECF subfamily
MSQPRTAKPATIITSVPPLRQPPFTGDGPVAELRFAVPLLRQPQATRRSPLAALPGGPPAENSRSPALRATAMSESMGPEQDSELMAQLAAGTDPALNALMERHAERLFQYLLRSLQNEEDAADLAQETFVKVYQNRHKFNPRLKFSTWLYAIASNLVRDRFRWRSRHPQVSLEAETQETTGTLGEVLSAADPTPDQHLQAEEKALAVRRAIANLPGELREPLILAVYEELPQAEISQILQCSVKAVETRIYGARQQLRASLSQSLSNAER